MELYLFRRAQWEQLYGCARFNVDEVPFTERYHPLNGAIVIGMFLLFELLYVPCMFSIWRHTEHSCYKLLFYIGLVDMAMLFIQGLESGVFNFTGEVFCSNRHFNYITASFAAGLFGMQTCANFFLAIDRCIDSFSPTLSNLLFAGKKVFVWMGLSTLLGLYYYCFVNPGIYNGIYANWFMNPYEGYKGHDIDFANYINPVTSYYGALLTFGFPAVYLLFVVLFLYRLREIRAIGNMSERNWKISMYVQVSLITGINILSFVLFAVMQQLAISKEMILVQFYVNYFVFGFPPLIYLTFNKTIRKDSIKYFGLFLLKLALKVYRPPNVVQSIHQVAIYGSVPPQIQRSTNANAGRGIGQAKAGRY